MEQLLVWMGTGLRVLLAGAIALLPGTVVWLTVLGIFLTIRRLTRGGLNRRQQQEGGMTPGTLVN